MKSAIKLVLGLSMFGASLSAVGCGSSSDSGPTLVATGSSGSGNGSAGGGSVGSAGTTGGGDTNLPPGIPLTAANGWVDKGSNTAGIQGALFTYADPTTMTSLTDTIKTTGMACMTGTAAKVDKGCMPPQGMDCYGVTWGAAMGLNLNQPTVPNPDGGADMGGTAVAFDAKAAGITGFAFNVTGDKIPAASAFRFLINDGASNQYCTPTAKGVKKGANIIKFSDLIEECWQAPKATDLKGDTAANNIVKIAWQIVTNDGGTVPFDFCIDSIEALTN